MNNGLPKIFTVYPEKFFCKISKPIIIFVILSGFVIRGIQYGYDFETKTADIVYMLGGIVLFELFLFIAFFAAGGRKMAQLARFEILYLAFVPNVSFEYLKRFANAEYVFSIREDLKIGRPAAALAMWYSKPLSLLEILVPVILLFIMAWYMTEKTNGLKKVVDVDGKPIHGVKTFTDGKLPTWYIVASAVAVVLVLLTLPFLNLMNLFMFIVKLIFVTMIWDMWERIRNNRSLEPTILVAWAEILLFLALWLKGLVENIG